MQQLKQSEATAARRRIFFTAVLASNVQTRQTGLVSGSFTVRISKAGAAEAAGAGSVVELEAADMPGIYYYEAAAADLDTVGPVVLRISYTNMEPREIVAQVLAHDPYDLPTAVLAATIHAGYSVARALRVIGGAVAGKLTGVSTNAPVARFLDDSGDAVTLATTADGRTTATHGA